MTAGRDSMSGGAGIPMILESGVMNLISTGSEEMKGQKDVCFLNVSEEVQDYLILG